MATLDVITLEEARIALDVTQTDEHDDELPAYITAVSQRLDALIGPIVQRTVTDEKHNGGDGEDRLIFLRHYPIASVASVTENGIALVADTDFYIDEYYANHEWLGNIVERWDSSKNRSSTWEKGRRNISVSYTAGRAVDTASVPELYKTAARLTLANFWRSQQDSSGGMGEFQVPQSYFPRWAIPQAVRQLLDNELQEPQLFI